MDEREVLAERFEENRARLRAVAYRMLGSLSEADEAVQEAWLRLHRTDANSVENLSGWLTTVVARVCLDTLRSRRMRREEALEAHTPEPRTSHHDTSDPERDALVADSVGLALLVVLDTLTPAERVAFVLHDMFDLPFEEIAPIVARTPAAARQLASRARRRVQGAATASGADRLAQQDIDRARQREIVSAFLAASQGGQFDTLIALLDPEVVLRADREAIPPGGSEEMHGAKTVAGVFSGRAKAAQLALIDGRTGLVWAPGGRPRVAFRFTLAGDTIAAIDLIADPERLSGIDVTILP